jgi:tetratricopeptide (TPR) repeat protein
MEERMKYFAFVILWVFALFVIFGISLAETDPEYDKAIHFYNSKKYTEAIMLLKEYVEKRPDASAYYRIGYALYKLRKFNEANKYFEMTYLIDPTFSPKKFGLPELPEHIKKSIQPPSGEVPSEQVPQMPETMIQEATPEPTPESQPSEDIQPPKPQEPTVTPSLPEP